MRAIVLKKSVFGEGSEIVTMFSEELGKLRAVARAVKSPKSRLAFGLHNFFLSEVELLPAKQLAAIIGARPLETFKNIRNDLNKISAAMLAAEVVLKATADEQANRELFNLLLEYFRHLDSCKAAGHKCLYAFALRAMALTGYALSFGACSFCAKELSGRIIYFSARKGNFLCAACAAKSSAAREVPAELYQLLRQSFSDNFESIDAMPASASELRLLVETFVSSILERNLNAAAYLATL